MELRSIYEIESFETADNKVIATIVFNKEHSIFKGHFPENPIVPGVVQIQIMKDLLEKALQRKLFLDNTKSIKYLNVINPIETGEVLFEILYEEQQENDIKIKCIVKTNSQVFMKLSGNALFCAVE